VAGKLYFLSCILLGSVLFFVWGYPVHERALAGENDFLQLYAGAKLAGTAELYSPEAAKRVHVAAVGESYKGVYYSRPPFYAALLKPLAWLPYRTAYFIFQLISLAAFGVFAALNVSGRSDVLFVICTSVPVLVNFTSGQDVSLVLCFASVALWLFRRRMPFWAGLVLSLCAIKFHLFLLVPIALIMHRRWRLLAGSATGGGILMAISFMAAGWNWPREYVAALRNPELHPGAEHMPTFRGVLDLAGMANPVPVLVLLGLVVVVLFVWVARKVSEFECLFGLALIGGLLICFHAYTQDCCVLVLAFALVAPHASAPLKSILLIAVLPPAYFMLLTGVPYNAIVPLLCTAAMIIAAKDAHERRYGAAAGSQAA
jgi:hypothetical protein